MEEVSAKYSENGTITVRNYDQHVKPIAEQIRALQGERAAALKDVIADPATSAQARAAAQAEFDELDKILNPPPPVAPKKSRAKAQREATERQHQAIREAARAKEAQIAQENRERAVSKFETLAGANSNLNADQIAAQALTKKLRDMHFAILSRKNQTNVPDVRDFVQSLKPDELAPAREQIRQYIEAYKGAGESGAQKVAIAKDLADAAVKDEAFMTGYISEKLMGKRAVAKFNAARERAGAILGRLTPQQRVEWMNECYHLYALHMAQHMINETQRRAAITAARAADEAAAKTSTAGASPAPTPPATAPNSNLREAIAKVAHAPEPTPPRETIFTRD